MRTLTRIATVLAAGALAVGMSACNEQVPVDNPPGSQTSAETTATGARPIATTTFFDSAVGLTQTCDQIITDFDAPVYEKGTDGTATIVLMHCKITTDDLLINWNLSSNLYIDGANYTKAYPIPASSIADDLEAAGLQSIASGEGTHSTEGWVAMTFYKEVDLTQGDWDVLYQRDRFESTETGSAYDSYSEDAVLVLM